MKRLLPFVFSTALVAAGFGQTAFEPIAGALRAQALSLPAQTPLVVLTPADKALPRQTITLGRTFAADGTFTVEWKGSTVQSSQTFRPDGTLLSARQSDSAKKATLEQTSDKARTTLRTRITLDGQVKSDKTAALKPGIALRDELQHLVLQAWQYGIRDGLKFQSLSPDGGMVGDFQILFVPTDNPLVLTEKYSYPDEFKTSIKGRGSYLVADMSLQGIGAFFFPHHFYLVYTVTPQGLRFEGYFGEDPKNPTFQYVPR